MSLYFIGERKIINNERKVNLGSYKYLEENKLGRGCGREGLRGSFRLKVRYIFLLS